MVDQVLIQAPARAKPAALDALEDNRVWNVNMNHGVKVVGFEKELRLRPVTREAVEQEAEVPVMLIEAILDDFSHDIIGNQLTGSHDAADARRELRVALNVPAEYIADTNVHQVKVALQQLGLSPLATALDAHENELVHDLDFLLRLLTSGPWSFAASSYLLEANEVVL